MSIPDGFAAVYECHDGTALYEVLSEAVRRGASDAHVTPYGGGGEQRHSVRFRVRGFYSEYQAPCDAAEMITELIRQPPKNLTDPALALIHALTNATDVARDLSMEARVDGQTARARIAYWPQSPTNTGASLVMRVLPTS